MWTDEGLDVPITRMRIKLILAGAVLVAALSYLAYAGIRSGRSYYLSVDTFLGDAQYHGQRVRLHGVVGPPTATAQAEEGVLRFPLQGERRRAARGVPRGRAGAVQAGQGGGGGGAAGRRRRLHRRPTPHQVRQQVHLPRRPRPRSGGHTVTAAGLGDFALAAAVLASCGLAVLASLAAVRQERPGLLRAGRRALYVAAGLLSACMAVLLAAILRNDFHLSYVAEYTERALPLGYKLAAFWAGQEGSLLLWAWLLAVLGVVAALCPQAGAARRAGGRCWWCWRRPGASSRPDALRGRCQPLPPQPLLPDGHGMNPMLQNPAMMPIRRRSSWATPASPFRLHDAWRPSWQAGQTAPGRGPPGRGCSSPGCS